MKLGLVLMASGAGVRFGSNKLLAEVEGEPLYLRAMAACPAALFDRPVVVSRYPQVLDAALARGYTALPNPHADEGISASIRLGMAEMAEMDGVLFAVCDQPWLTRASVERLLDAFTAQPRRIAALGWQGEKGNPCLFPASLFLQLAALSGDRGGGAVIRANPDALLLVEAQSPRELWDVDTPGDALVL